MNSELNLDEEIAKNNNNSIKNIFMYNDCLYKQVEKENIKKLILKLTIFSLIEVICIFYIIYRLNLENVSEFQNIIFSISMGMALVIFFPWFYHLLIAMTSMFGNKDIFSDRCYIITNDNKFLSMKFIRNNEVLRYNPNRDILISILNLIYTENSINNDNERIKEKVLNSDIKMKDLYSCVEIINVYDIKESYNKYKVKCDYVEKISKETHLKDYMIIYKYFNNYQDIYNYLMEIKNRKKQIIKESSKQNQALLNFAVSACENKNIYYIAIIITLYYLLTNINDLYIAFVLLFFVFFASVYITKKGKKNATEENDLNKLNKKLKIDRIIMWFLLSLSIIFALILKVNLLNFLLMYFLICFFVIVIILMFNRKEK